MEKISVIIFHPSILYIMILKAKIKNIIDQHVKKRTAHGFYEYNTCQNVISF